MRNFNRECSPGDLDDRTVVEVSVTVLERGDNIYIGVSETETEIALLYGDEQDGHI